MRVLQWSKTMWRVTMNVQLKTRRNGPRASVQALRSRCIYRFDRLRDRTLAVDLFHRRSFQVSLASSHRRHVRLTPLSLLSKASRRWNTIRSTCSHSLPLSHFRLSREFPHSGTKNLTIELRMHRLPERATWVRMRRLFQVCIWLLRDGQVSVYKTSGHLHNAIGVDG